MELFDPCRFFIHGLLGKVAVMGRTAWPAMVFLLCDLLHGFLLDLFSLDAAVGVLWRVYPPSPLRFIQPKLCAMALLFGPGRGNPVGRRIGFGMDSVLCNKEKPSTLVALSGPAGAALLVFHNVDPTCLDCPALSQVYAVAEQGA